MVAAEPSVCDEIMLSGFLRCFEDMVRLVLIYIGLISLSPLSGDCKALETTPLLVMAQYSDFDLLFSVCSSLDFLISFINNETSSSDFSFIHLEAASLLIDFWQKRLS